MLMRQAKAIVMAASMVATTFDHGGDNLDHRIKDDDHSGNHDDHAHGLSADDVRK